MIVFFNLSLHTSRHLHPLQVENCDSNSRFVVDEDDNGKCRLERVKKVDTVVYLYIGSNNSCFFQLQVI